MRSRRTLQAMLAVLAAVAVLVGAPAVRAAVPMCDELAQTIAAPLLDVPLEPGAIKAIDCPERGALKLGATPPSEKTPQVAPPELPDRALAFGYHASCCPRLELVPVARVRDGERPAYHARHYRPPRS